MRLRHTPEGFLRYMQMSSVAIFAFVEGRDGDCFFYDRLCAIVCEPVGLAYQVHQAVSLPLGGGGKQSLLSFFRDLERRNGLLSDLGKKRTACIFFLDKDIDDLLGRLVVSDHVVYTPHYDVESHIFENGHLADCLASLAGLLPLQLAGVLRDPRAWMLGCVRAWRDWVAFCIFCQRYELGVNGYGTTPTDPLNLDLVLTRSGMGENEFRKRLAAEESFVDSSIANGGCFALFKGKWYVRFAVKEAERAASGLRPNLDAVRKGLVGALAQSIDYHERWAEPFLTRIGSLADAVLA